MAQVGRSMLASAQMVQVARVLWGVWGGECVELDAGVSLESCPADPASVHGVLPAGVGEGAGGCGDGLVADGAADRGLPGVVFLGEPVQKGLKDGGRGGAGHGEVPHPVGDGAFVRCDGPGRLAGIGLVDAFDPQSL